MRDWLNARLQSLLQKSAQAGPDAGTPTEALQPVEAAPSLDAMRLFLAGHEVEAADAATRRLAAFDNDPEALHVQALQALERGQSKAAVDLLTQAVSAAPGNVETWAALAHAHSVSGKRAAAREALARAVALQANHPAVLAELALASLDQRRPDEAEKILAHVVGAGPRIAQAYFQLANNAREAGRSEDAQGHYRRAIAAFPRHALAHSNLGGLLKDRQQVQGAVSHFQEALRLQPDMAEAAYNLAMLRLQQRQWPEMAELLRRYVALRPKDADGQYWLANACMGQGDDVQARRAYQAALRMDGSHVQARWGFTMAQLPAVAVTESAQTTAVDTLGQELDKARAWFRTHHGAEGWRAVGAQQPFYLAYIAGNHKDLLARYGSLCTTLMAAWARRAALPKPVPATAGARLKLGIVSAHIQNHSVWHAVLRGWLEHLDPAQFEIHVFHTGPGRDAETEWAARRANRFHHGVGDWMAWARLLSDARLDVVIYPEIGMDATTVRLSALRLARVQLAGWGHPITTGLPTIDGYISGEAFEPDDAASHYTEQLIALPRLGCSYRPYGVTPKPADLSAHGIGAGDRLLLCAGVAFKYAPHDDALWIDVARRCAPCKLVFFRAENDHTAALLEQRLRTAFDAAGEDFDARVRFVPWQSHAAFFGLLQRADAFLDSVGFSGFNTAMQAIECGTPVLAWEGRSMRGRFASGILRQMGLDEWVASSAEDFAAAAQRLCADANLRKEVRADIARRRDALYNDKASVDALAAHLQRLATAKPG